MIVAIETQLGSERGALTPFQLKRPWWKLHALTWLAGALVAGALVLKNFEATYKRQSTPMFAPQAWHVYVGWPFWFGVEFGTPWDDSLITIGTVRRVKALVANVVVGLAILLGAASVIERQARRGKLQTTTRLLLALTAWAACYTALSLEWMEQWETEVHRLASAIVFGALALAWLAFFDLLGLVWNRLSRREG